MKTDLLLCDSLMINFSSSMYLLLRLNEMLGYQINKKICGKICRVGLYTEQFYAIIPPAFC